MFIDKRKFAILVLLMAAITLLYAAGQKESKEVTLEFITWAPYSENLIASFEQANPGIKVNYQQIPAGNYAQIISTRLAAQDLDVAGIRAENYIAFRDSGYLLDLSDKPFIDNYYDWALADVIETDGNIYAVPMGVFAEAVFYNKTLFKSLGLSIPETIEDMLAIAEIIKQAGIIPFIAGNSAKWTNSFNALPFIHSLAARKGNLSQLISSGQMRFTDPELIDVLAKAKDMINKGYIGKDSIGVAPPQAMEVFLQQKAAMMIQGTWFINGMKGIDIPFELGVFPIPVARKGDKLWTPQIKGIKTAVIAQSKHPEAALRFIEYISTADLGGATYYNEIGHYPTIKDVAIDEPLLEMWETVINNDGFTSFRDTLPQKAQDAYYTGLQELFSSKPIQVIAADIQKGFEQ